MSIDMFSKILDVLRRDEEESFKKLLAAINYSS